MKLSIRWVIPLFLFVAMSVSPAKRNIPPRSFTGGVQVGFFNGFGPGIHLGLYHLDSSIPIGFDGGLLWTFQTNPGNANDARKIYINDNQGGTVDESGYTIRLSMNVNYLFYTYRSMDFLTYAGPRYSFYRAHYIFIGDNEDFFIRTTQFGFGAGIRPMVKVSKRLFVFMDAGVEYIFPSRIDAHGEFYYNPDSEDDKPRKNTTTGKDYTYEEASDTIRAPSWEILATAGVEYNFN